MSNHRIGQSSSQLGGDGEGVGSSTISFQDVVTNLLVQTEELHRKLGALAVITTDNCFRILQDVEDLLAQLYSPELNFYSEKGANEIEVELRKHCLQKTTNVAIQALTLVVSRKEPDPEDDDYDGEEEKECQSAIARLSELNLVLCCDGDVEGKNPMTKKNVDEIIDVYASYQKQVIRQRSKPSIARLVDYRKRQKQMEGIIAHGSEEDDDDNPSSSTPHIQVLTTILGQATALIHPLMLWRSNLPPQSALFNLCTRSIETVDEQAQSLAKTVAMWFIEDAKIDEYWMAQMNAVENNIDGYLPSDDTVDIDLADLDTVVDRLAFCCQIFDRYIELVVKENETLCEERNASKMLQEIAPEWTWKYASLERFLTTQQLRSALHPSNNMPIEIIVGASIQVPSVVEDAQYLSTRALKRASSTRSDQAIGTVAHSVASDVWATDTGGNGIYEALIEQRGCFNPQNEESSSTVHKSAKNNSSVNGGIEPPPKSASNNNSFAQSLLGALDEDTVSSSSPTKPCAKLPNSGSGSLLGTFSSSLVSSVAGGNNFLQIRLNTYLCALNGIHSASTACSSLVDFLDSLLSPGDDNCNIFSGEGIGQYRQEEGKISARNSMVHLAREELFRYSRNYDTLLQSQIAQFVREFCGDLHDSSVYKGNTMVPVLRYYLERESFDVHDADHLSRAEDDARLHQILIRPMNDCPLLQQFDKCDIVVLRLLCEEIAHVLSELLLNIITSSSIPKRFTDWGGILFSKEVRVVQNHLQGLMQQAVSTATASYQDQVVAVPVLTSQWERLSQAVTILQLEKPSDWSAYYQETSVFSPQELQTILSLRLDFSGDAIRKVVASAGDLDTSHK